MKSAQDWIHDLKLEPHPEGGYYKETYRASQTVQTADGKDRSASTVIYYLLKGGTRSYLHRLKSDEVWYFHEGCPLEVVCIDAEGVVSVNILGINPHTYEHQHLVIPAGTWFSAVPKNPTQYTLVSCSVAPGFDFDDFEIGSRPALSALFPQHVALIKVLTRDT